MTTKQMLFFTLIIGSIANNALSTNEKRTIEQRRADIKQFLKINIMKALSDNKSGTDELGYELTIILEETLENQLQRKSLNIWSNLSDQLKECKTNPNNSCDEIEKIADKESSVNAYLTSQALQTPESRAFTIYHKKCLPSINNIRTYQANRDYDPKLADQEIHKLKNEIFTAIDSI